MESIMPYIKDAVILIICSVVIPLLTKAIILGINKISSHLEEKISVMKDTENMELAKKSINFIEELCTTTVEYLNQEFADEIRKKISTGEADRADLFKLKDQAIERVMSQLSEETISSAKLLIEDVEKYVGDLISQEVRASKKWGPFSTSE